MTKRFLSASNVTNLGTMRNNVDKKKSDNKATNYLTKETGEAFICELVEVPDFDIWVADTGCTEHVRMRRFFIHILSLHLKDSTSYKNGK